MIAIYNLLLYHKVPRGGKPGGGGKGYLLIRGFLVGMCRLIGSHFHNWIDYRGVEISIELLEWGVTFWDFLG